MNGASECTSGAHIKSNENTFYLCIRWIGSFILVAGTRALVTWRCIYIWHMAACMCRRIVEVTMYISVIAGEAVGFICSRIIVVLASIDDRQYGTHIHTCSAAATTMHIDNDCEHSQHDDTHSVSTITLYTYKCVAHNTYTLNTQKHTDSRSCHIDVSSPSLIGNVYIVKQLKRRDLAEENDNWIYL